MVRTRSSVKKQANTGRKALDTMVLEMSQRLVKSKGRDEIALQFLRNMRTTSKIPLDAQRVIRGLKAMRSIRYIEAGGTWKTYHTVLNKALKVIQGNYKGMGFAAHVNALRSDFGSTVLVAAALSNRIEDMRVLLEAGANVNAKDHNGETVLSHLASLPRRRSLEGVKLLLAAGGNVNAKTNYGRTPLMNAAMSRKYKDDDPDPVSFVKLLIAAGAKVNPQDNNGDTALMLACRWGNPSSVKELLRANAAVNLRNKDGHTALMFSSHYADCDECITLLMNAGANPSITDAKGQTALFHALTTNRPNSVRALITMGANTRSPDVIGQENKIRRILLGQ